jgi:hypothetical protein
LELARSASANPQQRRGPGKRKRNNTRVTRFDLEEDIRSESQTFTTAELLRIPDRLSTQMPSAAKSPA